MNYLTYDEYVLLGGKFDSSTFLSKIDLVSALVRDKTFGRIEKMREIPRTVKLCCRDLIEFIQLNYTTEKNITSRSTSSGSVSESVSYQLKNYDEMIEESQSFIRAYLSTEYDDNGTPLLYKGCAK